MKHPTLCYTIWFTQRTGSTWLCQALESTNVAGRPRELFYAADPERLVQHYGASTVSELIAKIHQIGSTPNRVFGLKQGFSEPRFSQLISLLEDGAPNRPSARLKTWERAFPNHKHVFMTRRNKVRLAVSWWRAIQSGEWHRRHDESASDTDMTDSYDFDAIDQLLNESVLREAGIQELFGEASIVPLTIVYEDLLHDPLPTFRRILSFLGIEGCATIPFNASFDRLADPISEAWAQRFRTEKQAGWRNVGW